MRHRSETQDPALTRARQQSCPSPEMTGPENPSAEQLPISWRRPILDGMDW